MISITERRRLTVIAIALPGIAVSVLFERFYFVREWLLFLVFAALLVFLIANLALLGILVHAAVRRVLHLLRRVKPEIVQSQGGSVGSRLAGTTAS